MVLYSPLFLQAATGDAAISYSATDLRGMISALAPLQGIYRAADLAVSQRAAGANMSVDVAAGRVIVQGTSVANQGTYICRSDAITNVTISAASTSNPRVDLIVARVYDKQGSGGADTTYGWNIYSVPGTPASSPVAPATPPNSLVLAQVYVPQNATSILNTGTNAASGTGSITDVRVLSGSGDVPKWDVYGTTPTPQTVGPSATVFYAPGGVFQQVGVTSTTVTGQQKILTPGRYVVHFCIRLTASSGVCDRVVSINLRNSAGTSTRSIANTATTALSQPVSTSGTVYIGAGSTIEATFFQNSGGTLSVTDPYFEADFTGTWVGP